MNTSKFHWLIAALVLIAIGLLVAFQFRASDGPKYFTAKTDRGDIRQVVEATGTINAVITVQVGSQVSGNISRLYVDFNSRVKKGQVIAQIDPALFEGALLQATADLGNARANLAVAQANLQKAHAAQVQTKADYERIRNLAEHAIMSPQQLDLAKVNYDTAVASLSAAEAQVNQAEAQVQQKTAAVKVAQTNVAYTTIRAPIDGTVIARNVDVGQTVAASLQAPTLFTIAQDLTKMQVYASTDESDVGSIRPRQLATFIVDAYPKQTFTGTVSQVRMNATTVQNVVTYNTIIDFDNPDLKLFPGMTAYVTIPVASVIGVLRVPNGALRYKPELKAQEIRDLYQRYGLEPNLQSSNGSGGAQRMGNAIGAKQQHGLSSQESTLGDLQNGRRRDVAVLWKLHQDKTLEPVKLRTGITDHTVTEVAELLNGAIQVGDTVVTGEILAGPKLGPGVTSAPRH
jgi:HlyD family secretion protein